VTPAVLPVITLVLMGVGVVLLQGILQLFQLLMEVVTFVCLPVLVVLELELISVTAVYWGHI
jgi:hypothetical protein